MEERLRKGSAASGMLEVVARLLHAAWIGMRVRWDSMCGVAQPLCVPCSSKLPYVA